MSRVVGTVRGLIGCLGTLLRQDSRANAAELQDRRIILDELTKADREGDSKRMQDTLEEGQHLC
jgi:hypothetical protein